MTRIRSPERIVREELIDSLKVGDLIRLNGSLRIVRKVHKYCGTNRTRILVFAIMRCSWTRKAYTVKTRSELYLVPLTVVIKGFGTGSSSLASLLQQDIDSRTDILKCCDVIGVVK